MVNISLRVLSKPDSGVLSQIYRSLGLDWDERVLPSIGNEVLKAVVAQYNAEQLLTQRDRVSRAVSMSLSTCSEAHLARMWFPPYARTVYMSREWMHWMAFVIDLLVSGAMQVRDTLTARAKEFNILIDDIAITHLSFGTEVNSSDKTTICQVHKALINLVLSTYGF